MLAAVLAALTSCRGATHEDGPRDAGVGLDASIERDAGDGCHDASAEFDAQAPADADATVRDADSSASDAPTPLSACDDPRDDRAFLYRAPELEVAIAEDARSFTVVRRADGRVLRRADPSERFFGDVAASLRTEVRVTPACGGVDITWSVHNEGATAERLPELRIEGLARPATGPYWVLDTRDAGNLRRVGAEGVPLGDRYQDARFTWPSFYYSPVLAAHDGDVAIVSAVLHDVRTDWREFALEMTRVESGPLAGTWAHRYAPSEVRDYARVDTFLASGESWTTRAAVRFAPARNWLFALADYREHLRATYGPVDTVRAPDRRPIHGHELSFCDHGDPVANPRGFRDARMLTDGWGPTVDDLVTHVTARGFERVMLWTPSGQYPCASGLNYPPAFTDFPSPLAESDDALGRFADAGIELGFWWGRAGQVPDTNGWPPPGLHAADLEAPGDRAFLETQLALAVERGARHIGLDAVGEMPLEDRLRWLDELKTRSDRQVEFAHEGSGPDITHRAIGNFYWPEQYWWWPEDQWNKRQLAGPDVLSRYLNPGSPIWVWVNWECAPEAMGGPIRPEIGHELAERYLRWGYTPVVGGWCYDVSVSELTTDVVACFDGIDNDGDEAVDWPRDPDCADATDDGE